MTYEEFINNILNTRGRFACGDEYHERHHIVPKCMGGSNEKENLIDLFAREHFEAHRLLALENPKNDSLVYAWWMMAHGTKREYQDRYGVTAEEYEEAKKHLCIIPKSEETKRKMSLAQLGEKNHRYGKHHTKESKKMLSEMNKGEKNKFYGKHHTDETKKILSQLRSIAIYCIETKQVYHSALIAQERTGVRNSSIGKCCSNKQKTAGGYQWKYLYDQIQKDGTIIPGAITLGLITEKEALRMLEEQKEAEGENENYGPQKEDCESN